MVKLEYRTNHDAIDHNENDLNVPLNQVNYKNFNI